MTIASDIVEKTDQKELDTVDLRERMDEDYARWRQDEFQGAGKGYRAYTSNEARVQAKLGIGMLSGAAMTVRVPQGNDDRDTRDQDNAKEQFILGNFRSNDRRLSRLGHHPLRQELSWHLPLRGITAGRATLVKKEGRVWADATPWDPREVMWEFGDDGLDYICHKYVTSRSSAEQQYGVKSQDGEATDAVLRYDYYDKEHNTVIIPAVKQEGWVRRQIHGAVDRVPGWVVGSTLQPIILGELTVGDSMANSQLSASLKDWGESIFADNRRIFDSHQFIMSIWLELVSRSRKPAFGIRSPSGTRLLEFDPFKEGAEIALQADEELIVYDFLKSAGDAQVLATVVSGEQQRGGFPVIMFGETPAAISGFAMNILKGPTMHKIMPYAQAKSIALGQITDIWLDEFATGAFGDGMELSGLGSNRKWFSTHITRDMLLDLPDAEIEIVPELPEDDAGKIQTALAYREIGPTGLPLLSDRDIREEKLLRQDSDRDLDSIMQEMAMKNPLVEAQRMTDALAKRGDEGSQWWHIQFQTLFNQFMQVALQGGVPPETLFGAAPNTNQNPQGSGGSFSPQILPNAGQGILPPTPGVETPGQQGPLVAPGTPRPGARSNGNLRGGVPPLP